MTQCQTYNKKQVAALLGIQPGTLNRWIEAGIVPAPIASTRFSKKQVDLMLDGQRPEWHEPDTRSDQEIFEEAAAL